MSRHLSKKIHSMQRFFATTKSQDLKRLGNDLISEAAIKGDKTLAKISVVSYALYKMLSKEHFVQSPQWPRIAKTISRLLERCTEALRANDLIAFNKHLDGVVKEIEYVDRKLSNYARHIFEKAKIKQASSAYARGLSINSAAALTGANPKELQRYIGGTLIHDDQPVTFGIRERLTRLKDVLSND